jgi:hypothetical protein
LVPWTMARLAGAVDSLQEEVESDSSSLIVPWSELSESSPLESESWLLDDPPDRLAFRVWGADGKRCRDGGGQRLDLALVEDEVGCAASDSVGMIASMPVTEGVDVKPCTLRP